MFGSLQQASVSTKILIVQFNIYGIDHCRTRKTLVKEGTLLCDVVKNFSINPDEYEVKSESREKVFWLDPVTQNSTYSLYLNDVNAAEDTEEDGNISLPSDDSLVEEVILIQSLTVLPLLGKRSRNFNGINSKKLSTAAVIQSYQPISMSFRCDETVSPVQNSTIVTEISMPMESFHETTQNIEVSVELPTTSSSNQNTEPVNAPEETEHLNPTFVNETSPFACHGTSYQHQLNSSDIFIGQVENLRHSISQLKTIVIVQLIVILLLFAGLTIVIYFSFGDSPLPQNKRWV